ncbi:MAG TPA: endonuclease III [Chloroflexota bacterium]|nr:endonuclease III [Chloroflexota bacterium]
MVARRAPAAAASPRARPAAPKPSAALRRRALAINTLLTECYDTPTHPESRIDPLSELIAVVLSQHTSDVNSERAFESLRARFADWESVRQAPTAAVADAIRSGGLAVIKAARIQRILTQVLEARGELSLDFLDALSLDEARAFLRGLDGVGPKSAACVLLFSLDKPAMPVDTHVHRVAGRLGLIPPGTSAEAAHEQLERLVPPEEVYRFHVNLIWHGRRICKAPRPRCALCPVNALCPYPSKTL